MARMQAGIQLKNHLYSKDYEIRSQYQQRWLTFPDDMKNFIKTNVSIAVDYANFLGHTKWLRVCLFSVMIRFAINIAIDNSFFSENT